MPETSGDNEIRDEGKEHDEVIVLEAAASKDSKQEPNK